MATLRAESRFRSFQAAVTSAHDYFNKKNYTAAITTADRAFRMVPRNHKADAFGSAYASGKDELAQLVNYAAGAIGEDLSNAQHKAQSEIERMKRGGRASPVARASIQKMEGYISALGSMKNGPNLVKETVHSYESSAADLRAQLERVAKSRGVELDWDAPLRGKANGKQKEKASADK
ncbi:MAG: hypothetical protein HY516_00715 [Candidatus Aenigmarchaeota archaeon]|nr:hypothetical protein [Candidatus Aenigmarchaeota archaeon]